jgi:hypothetical protein
LQQRLRSIASLREGRKAFFFEKKKQKTFGPYRRAVANVALQ